jgi:hypothetical protein
MKNFLIRIKLIDYLSTSLSISRNEFVDRLYSITDEGSIGMFAESMGVFSSSSNEFRGHVDFDGFRIKRRRRFFEPNMNIAIATGIITENNGRLNIETEINGFNNFMIFFYCILILFYSIFIFGFIFSDNNGGFFALPFILIHGAFMFSLPYFMIRRSVNRLKYELEREFFYLTKDK